jgi:hypothetical protein
METKEEGVFEDIGEEKNMINMSSISDISFEVEKIREGSQEVGRDLRDTIPKIEDEEEAMASFKDYLYAGDIIRAKIVADKSINDKETVDKIALMEFRFSLSGGDIYKALNIREEFGLADNLFTDREVKKSALEGFRSSLSKGDVGFARVIKESFSLEEVDFLPVAKEIAEDALSRKEYTLLKEIEENFIPDRGMLDGIVLEATSPSREFPENVLAVKEAEKAFIHFLKEANVMSALGLKESFALEESFLKGADVLEAAIEGIGSSFEAGDIAKAAYIKNVFGIDNEHIKDIITERFNHYLSEGEVYGAISMKEEFRLEEDFFLREEVISSAGKGFSVALSKGDVASARIIKEAFRLDDQSVLSAADSFFNDFMIKGEIGKAQEIRDNFIEKND